VHEGILVLLLQLRLRILLEKWGKADEDLDRVTVTTSDVLKQWTTFQLPVKLPHRLWNVNLPFSCSLPNAFCVLNILFRLDLTPVLACVSVRKNISLPGFALKDHQWNRKHTWETLTVLKTKQIILLHSLQPSLTLWIIINCQVL